MTDIVATQAKADAVAATFNRLLRKAEDAAPSVEKVAMLHLVRSLLEEFKAEAGSALTLTGISAVEESLRCIEADCRTSGSFEAFANMSRAARRRLQRQMGEV